MGETVATRERPILFSGPLVRAILAGRKTQTRRVVEPQPHECHNGDLMHKDRLIGSSAPGRSWADLTYEEAWDVCPYGQPGDRLWVRERHSLYKPISAPADSVDATYACFPDGSQVFKAGGYHPWSRPVNDNAWPKGHRWRPSIHMPRWASRITLELTGVRVERLQAVSEEDAIAEGVDAISVADVPRQASWSRRQDFARLWDSINGKRPGCNWEANPWVWCLSFRRLAPAEST